MAGDRTRIGLWRPQVGLERSRGGVHVHFAMHIAEADYDAAVEALRAKGSRSPSIRSASTRARRISTTPTAIWSSCGRGTSPGTSTDARHD